MVGLYTTNLQVVKTKKYDANQVCEIFNRILRRKRYSGKPVKMP